MAAIETNIKPGFIASGVETPAFGKKNKPSLSQFKGVKKTNL